MKAGDLVKFLKVNNARGYPLTGELIDVGDDFANVRAFGLVGPGVDSEVRDVPLADIEALPSP